MAAIAATQGLADRPTQVARFHLAMQSREPLSGAMPWMLQPPIPAPFVPHPPCSTLPTCMLCTLPREASLATAAAAALAASSGSQVPAALELSAESRGFTAATWPAAPAGSGAAGAGCGQRRQQRGSGCQPAEQQRSRCWRPRSTLRHARPTLLGWRDCARRRRGQLS